MGGQGADAAPLRGLWKFHRHAPTGIDRKTVSASDTRVEPSPARKARTNTGDEQVQMTSTLGANLDVKRDGPDGDSDVGNGRHPTISVRPTCARILVSHFAQ